MSNDNFWKGVLKFFLLCAGSHYKRNQHVGRSFNPMDENSCPRDPAHLGLHEQMIEDADVNSGRK